MAEFKIDGRMTVRTLKENFKKEFEGTLRVYDGREKAEDNATLASIRKNDDVKGGELVCRASRTVGKFEKEMLEVFGIKVQVASPDDWVLALDGITLANLKNIKKNATKADMEELVAYKRKDKDYTEDLEAENDAIDEEGFSAVFIGSGAGLPRFMNIPGEHFNGVFSANEFLTRNNLMKAYRADYDTPIHTGRKVVVVGGGNVAMDAGRTALRLGAETTIVYRRTEKELPARAEEVHHAKEEGIEFAMLTNPVEVIGDENGWVKAVRCIRMELGEPDESGRRSPVEIPGSEFEIETDTVIMSLGTSPNPLIAKTTKGLETTRRGCLVADENGATTRPGVFAGGDAVTGAATVILAMGAGRKAAAAIHSYIQSL